MDLTVKTPAFVNFHLTSLATSSSRVYLPSPHNNLSASSTSQSLKSLENIGFQPLPLVALLQYSLTHASLEGAKTNNEGKETFRGISPSQISFQNLIPWPLPTSKDKVLLTLGQQLRIAFQKPNPNPPIVSRVHQPPSCSPYFPLITSF